MKLIELLSSPWAIRPDSLREIQQIYATHLKGEKIDLEAVEARLGRPLANDQQAYVLREGGVAVLRVDGVIAPKANLFTRVSGGVSAEMLIEQIHSAAADMRVKSLVQVVDSPGGSVFGTPEWAAAAREFAKEKPLVTVSDATIASAAYWGGSAANAIYLTGPTVQAGSIGVYTRMSLSQPDPTGVEFTRGQYKRGSMNGAPPSEEFMAYFDAQLDHLYSVFVEAVAENRGVSVEDVLEHMADGRVFIGQQAVDAGLVDGFASVDDLVEQLATNPAKFRTRRKAVFALGEPHPMPAGARADDPSEPVLLDSEKPPIERTIPMDRATLEQQHPTLFAQLQTEFTAAGAAAELTRINGVRATVVPGHEALVERLAFDGKTSPGDAALAVNAAVRQAHVAAAQAHEADAPKPAAHSPAPADRTSKTKAEQAAEATELAAKEGIDFLAALKKLGHG